MARTAAVVVVSAAIILSGSLVVAKRVTLSNTALPLDTAGHALLTGEASVAWDPAGQGQWTVLFNDWGGCVPVDCCPSTAGCASCCFNPPSPAYPDACVYTANHTINAYTTPDFATWTFRGPVQTPAQRRPGVEFRPQLLYSAVLQLWLMWYEDRWTGGTNPGYAIATAPASYGPFTTLTDSVRMVGKGRVGDFSLFVDPADGACYHVRTGLTVERLTPNCTAPSGVATEVPNGGVEGPSMFARAGVYYLTAGVGCCACRGGSNVVVYTAPKPLGPWTLLGDVGSNSTAGHAFDKHSPFNYVTRAQGSAVVRVPAAGGADGAAQYLWLGNAFVSSPARDSDLLYWTVLEFNDSAPGSPILQIVRQDETVIIVP